MAESGSNPNPAADPFSDSRCPSDAPAAGPHQKCILIVEDNEADALLMREAMGSAGVTASLHVIDDGEKAIRFIDAADASDSSPCPALIVLDLNLPRRSGAEVLAHVRHSRKCPNAIVVVATSSDAPADREAIATLGADAYFCKPSNFDAFMKLGDVVRTLLNAPAARSQQSEHR